MTNSALPGIAILRNGSATAEAGLAEPSDEELVHRVEQGDEQAFARLLNRHLGAIHHYLYRLTGSRADSDDLAQETFLAVWRRSGTYRPGRVKFTTWLHRIAHNHYVDHYRKGRRTASEVHNAIAETADSAPGPQQSRSDEEDRRRLHQALARLPPNQRDAVLLCHQQGLSNRDAAVVLGVGVRALESLLARARRTLRKEFPLEAKA